MTRKELDFIKKLLEHVKPQDEQVAKALALIEKDLANYDSRRGQLLETYEQTPW